MSPISLKRSIQTAIFRNRSWITTVSVSPPRRDRRIRHLLLMALDLAVSVSLCKSVNIFILSWPLKFMQLLFSSLSALDAEAQRSLSSVVIASCCDLRGLYTELSGHPAVGNNGIGDWLSKAAYTTEADRRSCREQNFDKITK